jgi:hypothetical protein
MSSPNNKPAPFLKDTAVGDAVEVGVTVDGPYGIIFEPDKDGNAAYISNWERLPDGKIGDVQRHSGVVREKNTIIMSPFRRLKISNRHSVKTLLSLFLYKWIFLYIACERCVVCCE